MSHGKTIPVNLRILDREYVIACPEEECDTLLAAAHYLNQKVKEVRDAGKVISTERMIVVSALNIIHEYFQYKQQREKDVDNSQQQIAYLEEKIGLALTKVKQ